jgi:hypothetical protein
MSNTNYTAIHALAWQICGNENRPPVRVSPEVRAALQSAISDGLLVEEDVGIRFADEQAMIAAATAYLLEVESDQLLVSPRSCFERLDQVFSLEIGKEYRVSGFALAELHNADRIDGFAWGKQAIEEGVDVFDVLHIMEGAISYFAIASVQSMCAFFAGHHEAVRRDLLGGILYAKLPPWLSTLPDIAQALRQTHELSPKESTASLYGCALYGLILHFFDTGFDLAFKSAQNPTALISGPALHILGLVDYADPPRFQELEQIIELCAGIVNTPGHPHLGTATSTLGRLLPRSEAKIVPLLHKVASTETPEVLYALSETLFRMESELREREWFWPLFLRLTVANAERKGVFDNIDMVLTNWINQPKWQDKPPAFLNAWIARQPIEVIEDGVFERLFDSTLHRLGQQLPLLIHTVTMWMLHDDVRYPMVASRVMRHFQIRDMEPMTLDKSTLDALQPNEIIFLVRRILGFIVDCDTQINLIFSLVRTRNGAVRTLDLVKEVLLDHVGYDYPYQIVEFLKKRQDSEIDQVIVESCREIGATLSSRLEATNSLPLLKELVPVSAKTHRFARERGKQMNKAIDEASKISIFRQLASHIVLKAGRKTFQNIHNRYTTPMELKEMSHSVAMPFSEISDPAGAALKRILFKTTTRNHIETNTR